MKEIIKNEIIKSIESNNNKEKAMSNNEVNVNVNENNNTMGINLALYPVHKSIRDYIILFSVFGSTTKG